PFLLGRAVRRAESHGLQLERFAQPASCRSSRDVFSRGQTYAQGVQRQEPDMRHAPRAGTRRPKRCAGSARPPPIIVVSTVFSRGKSCAKSRRGSTAMGILQQLQLRTTRLPYLPATDAWSRN